MKNLSITLIAFFIVLTSCAKTPTTGYNVFYKEYRDTPHTITFKIPGAFAGMFLDDEDKEVKEFVKKMDNVSFFVAENVSKQMIIDLNKSLPESLYKEIMIINSGAEVEVIFLARDNGDVIEEIVMTVIDDNELVVMCMYGEFTRDDAKKIVKAVEVDNAIKISN